MYDNIGGKIKGLAKIIFIVEAIAAAISGLALIVSNEETVFAGLLAVILGPVAAWVSSWLLYGFGEIVEKVSEIERNTRGEEKKPEA